MLKRISKDGPFPDAKFFILQPIYSFKPVPVVLSDIQNFNSYIGTHISNFNNYASYRDWIRWDLFVHGLDDFPPDRNFSTAFREEFQTSDFDEKNARQKAFIEGFFKKIARGSKSIYKTLKYGFHQGEFLSYGCLSIMQFLNDAYTCCLAHPFIKTVFRLLEHGVIEVTNTAVFTSYALNNKTYPQLSTELDQCLQESPLLEVQCTFLLKSQSTKLLAELDQVRANVTIYDPILNAMFKRAHQVMDTVVFIRVCPQRHMLRSVIANILYCFEQTIKEIEKIEKNEFTPAITLAAKSTGLFEVKLPSHVLKEELEKFKTVAVDFLDDIMNEVQHIIIKVLAQSDVKYEINKGRYFYPIAHQLVRVLEGVYESAKSACDNCIEISELNPEKAGLSSPLSKITLSTGKADIPNRHHP